MVEVIFDGPEFDENGIRIPETKYGKKLKKIIENEFEGKEHISGKIFIQSCVQIFGQNRRDFDLIVTGYFNNKSYKIKNQDIQCTLLSKDKDGNYKKDREPFDYIGDVICENFCFTIEIKSHRSNAIRLNNQYNLEVLMEAKRGKSTWHNATIQSEGQKFSLQKYLKLRTVNRINKEGVHVRVQNFIWLVNTKNEDLKNFYLEKANESKIQSFGNILPGDIKSFYSIFRASIYAYPPIVFNNKSNTAKSSSISKKNTFDREDIFREIFEIFTEKRVLPDGMTRTRVEQISRSFLKKQKYFEEIQDKLTIISGRPGTGKTIKLLRMAMDLTSNHDARCLILSYNKALTSDIKRTLHHTSLRKVDEKIVVKTIHKFIYDLLRDFEIVSSHPKDFTYNYEEYLKELKEYIDTGAISEEDIKEAKEKNSADIAFDHILVDEGQDSNILEKEILFSLFGENHVIVTEGPNQMVRGGKECVWEEGMTKDRYNKVYEKIGLRQKSNLVNFVNSFANSKNLDWSVDIKEDLLGGNIVISNQDYSTGSQHKELEEQCIKDGNEPYDMMLLIPSKYDIRKLKKNGINFWNGADQKIRNSEYSDSLDENRLFYYHSCRGLEGWSVSCIEFDSFVEEQIKKWNKNEQPHMQEDMFTSDREKRELFAYSWATIAMTRAIDTIYITLKDKNSDVGKILYNIYSRNKDFITWID